MRLLRFLASGPATLTPIVGGPAPAAEILRRRDGRTHAATLLVECSKEDLCRVGDAVEITREGRAWLARHDARSTEDAFARQHQDRETIVLPEGETGPARAVAVNRNTSPLGRLARRRDAAGGAFIDDDCVEAGERLARDFRIGGMVQRVTSSWDPSPRPPGRGPSVRSAGGEAALDARARLTRAVETLGPHLSGVAMDICCFEKGIAEVERDRRWPPRSAKLMLRTALEMLVRHYGIRTGAVAQGVGR